MTSRTPTRISSSFVSTVRVRSRVLIVIVGLYTNCSLSMVCAMVCANEVMGAIGQC